ncbi:MAG: hypothetical protein JO085_07635 [Acidimicrobiia bacterium]|nr:hypothetical protein [Acidimicrobiia bacterium]
MSAASRQYIAPVSFGLGDLVVSLPVVQAALVQRADSTAETWLVTRSPTQTGLAGRIVGLAGTVRDRCLALGPSDVMIDLRDHPLQREHWWGSPEFEAACGAMSINDILGRIASDFGITADFSAPVPLEAHPRGGVDDLVVLIVDSDGSAKRWPADRWVALAALLANAGFRAAVVTRGDQHHFLASHGLDPIVASTPGDAVDVLSGCRAAIGVDTGLTHIAAQQGTPTITLCREPPVYFREWDHTRVVTGARCDATCQRTERAYADRQRETLDADAAPRTCPSHALCLQAIEPPMVLKALQDLC